MNCNLECFLEILKKLSDFVFFHASFLTVYPIGFTCLFRLSVQFSHSVVSDPLWPHGLQHARLPHPSWTPELYSNSGPLSWWCHPAISSLLSPSPPSSILPSTGVFPVSQFFTSGGQNTGASVSASDLPMNIQDWFPSGLTRLISLQSKGLSRVFSNTKNINSVVLSFLCGLTLTSIHDYWKNHIALTRQTFVGKVMSLLFNMLSGLL